MNGFDNLLNSFAAAVVIAAIVYGFFKWISDVLNSGATKRNMLSASFQTTLADLSSGNSTSQLAAAILLRRYFNAFTRSWCFRKKYFLKNEALNVISSALRTLPTSVLQKTLADGMAYIKNISGADFQRTNLQDAYIGNKKHRIKMRSTDFFRADLSNALLDNTDARGAIFYNAILFGTRLKNSDLSEANFSGADLSNCSFSNCCLYMANFKNAHHVPTEILNKLQDNIYPFKEKVSTTPTRGAASIFFSMPGTMTKADGILIAEYKRILTQQGFNVIYYTRDTYPKFGQLGRVRQSIRECAGIIAFGFKQLHIDKACFRPGTTDEATWEDRWLSTPWNELEVGMGLMNNIPVLLVHDRDINFGVFDESLSECFVSTITTDTDTRELENNKMFMQWMSSLREC